MNATDILDAIRASIDHGQIADAIRSQVSSPAGAPDLTGWLSADVIRALDTLDDDEAMRLVDELHAIA